MILFTIVMCLTLTTSLFSQSMYFRLTEQSEKAIISNSTVEFLQAEIQSIIGEKNARPVLLHPDKYHSKYAKILARTFQLNLKSLPQKERDAIEKGLNNSKDIELVEIAEEPVSLNSNSRSIDFVENTAESDLMPCPTDDPSDAAWNLSRHEITCVQEAHCITQGDSDIWIAIIDDGFIDGHPEHIGQVVYVEPGAVGIGCGISNQNGHGTQTSITAAGATDNGFGISSSGYNCSLMLYSWGGFVGNYTDLLNQGARVVNNSYINGCSSNGTFQTVINMVTEMGVIVVGSAGNGNTENLNDDCGGTNNNNPTYPSAYDNVISVSSVSADLCTETTFNFWGDPYDPPLHHTHNETVDLLAQGYAVVTGDCNGGGQAMAYGTSIAGPHVAGIIGLMLSVNPCLNHDDVLDILVSTGQDVSDVCNNQTWYPNGVPPVPCAESAVIMAQNYIGDELVINEDTDWDQKFVSGNVRIINNSTLTIFGEASLAINSNIIVEDGSKLIVDGGRLTSCGETWKGIQVYGGNWDFDVKFTNGAIVENTSSAAVSMFAPLPWPEISNYGNGILQADNSTFNNVKRIAEFIAFQSSANSSYIRNCVQNGGTWSVTNWNCQGIEIKNNIFNDITKECVRAADGSYLIEGNEFHGGNIDIVLSNTSAGFGSQIFDNEFFCTKTNIRCNNSSFSINTIHDNQFPIHSFGNKNIYLSGLNRYNVYNNHFEGYYGVYCTSTGSSSNIINNNTFSQTRYGIRTFFNNSGLIFTNNCFEETQSQDIRINNSVAFFQTNPGFQPANNCFTHNGSASSTIESIHGNPNFFYYVEPSGNDVDCKDAIHSHSNVYRYKSGADGPSCVQNRQAAPNSIFQENVENKLLSGDYKGLRKLLEEDKDLYKYEIFSTYILENDLNSAKDYLKLMNVDAEVDKDFIQVQDLNIKRISKTGSYKATSFDLTTLEKIARKQNEVSGMANSIYAIFTGNFVQMEDLKEDESNDEVENRTTPEASPPTIFPNPATDVINISFKESSKIDVSIRDYYGNIVLIAQSEDLSLSINVSNLKEGLYYLEIIQNDTNHFIEKIFIQ